MVEVLMSNTQSWIEDAKPSGLQVIWDNIAKEAAKLANEHDLPSP